MNSKSAMEIVNIHLSKIDVVKFDGTNNFGMRRCEVMDALMASNLKDALILEEKPDETFSKDWDKMNKATCGVIISYLTQNIKYHVMTETSAKKIWEILKRKYLTNNIKNHLHLKRRLHRFQLKRGISIGEHMNNYMKLLADLANVCGDRGGGQGVGTFEFSS